MFTRTWCQSRKCQRTHWPLGNLAVMVKCVVRQPRCTRQADICRQCNRDCDRGGDIGQIKIASRGLTHTLLRTTHTLANVHLRVTGTLGIQPCGQCGRRITITHQTNHATKWGQNAPQPGKRGRVQAVTSDLFQPPTQRTGHKRKRRG